MTDVTSPATRRRTGPLDKNAAAKEVGCAPRTLDNWRSQGRGPRFIRVGRLVRYRLEDLEAYLESRTVETDNR